MFVVAFGAVWWALPGPIDLPHGLPAPDAPTAIPGVVRFVALGDTGRGNATQRRVAAGLQRTCADRGCDLILLLGDLLYPAGMESDLDPRMDQWGGDLYGAIGPPIYAVLGNHDYGHGGRFPDHAARTLAWAVRTPSVTMPATSYAFDAGPAHFIGVDTTRVFWEGAEPQATWVREHLDRSEWTVVFGHHPYRSNGQHGNAGSWEGIPNIPWVSGRSMREFAESALCGRADLYLCGHEHNLQWIEACGTTFLVSGAGASTTALKDRGNDPIFADDTPGFVWVELGTELRVAFFDADGIVKYEGQRPK